ncbi:CCA tRNA nucleotidyltransferase [Lachnospira multipara]|uniref:tRNA nucleotidyltransferase (CCA-adding enzyme) n=1 Tax=Lachnospira multipara TaxID=28051 RepID=A0A1H5WTZ5_9FIRM|nr:CCA tRNA nucleotidyltransferase [Lachnospira multipara]SEG02911.1 tRNA nucleotidyltransferase (CCA-adding enzyme) [Lachnospira multipara]
MDTNFNKEAFSLELPEDVKFIISKIEENGHSAYAVGGCVRDTLLEKEPQDWDITTSALPTQVKSLFRRTIDTGIEHGTVTVMIDKNGYEVTTYRIDGEYKDGRHPESVEFSVLLTDDLSRRDFTINAMAYNDSEGLVDEYGGIADLNNKLIRCVGVAHDRFTEDALRMMRAIRFSAQLGFDIENETMAAIYDLAPTIKKISMERVHVELGKTLLSDNPEKCLLYSKTGLFKEILPYIDEALTNKHTRRTLAAMKYFPKEYDKDLLLRMRYAILFSSLGSEAATKTLKTLKMDNVTIRLVGSLLDASEQDIQETEPSIRESLRHLGRDLFFLTLDFKKALSLAASELTGISNPVKISHYENLKKMATNIINRGDCFSIKELDISGNDLLEFGLSGKDIGKTLEYLLDLCIENPRLNEKSTLLSMIPRD